MSANRPVPLARSIGIFVTPLAGGLALIVGGMVLVGWALDIMVLKSILPGWTSVKPNAALAFVLTGLALLFPQVASDSRLAPFLARLARLCGLLASLIGLLTLGEYVCGWNPGFDQWLFRESTIAEGTSNPGRMAPDTALCFVLLGAGLGIARAAPTRWTLITTAVLGALVMSMALASITTYFTPAIEAFGWWSLTVMAVPTAVLFAIFGASLILVAWQEGASRCSLGRRIVAAYVCALTLVVFIGLYSSRSLIWLSESARRVTHAEQVTSAITGVFAEATKAQAHTRGYVITGEERYPQSQQAVADQCRTRMKLLRQLIIDPAQQARCARLETQLNEMLQWYSRVIEARRTGVPVADLRGMVNHGEDLMDNLCALIREMNGNEARLRQERQQESENVARFTHLVIYTGTLVSLIVFAFVLFDLNRAVIARQRAAEELGFGKMLLESQNEASIDGILNVDEGGKVIWFNRRFADMWGIPDDVVRSRDDQAAMHVVLDKLTDCQAFDDKIKYLHEHKEIKSRDEIRLKDGRVLDRYSSPVVANDGAYLGRIWLFRDITKRKAAEDALQQAFTDLEQSKKDLIASQMNLINLEKLEIVGRLAAGVAHEVKNPLGILMMGLDYLFFAMPERDGPLAEVMKDMKTAILRADSIIRELLDFSTAERLELQPDDLNSVIEEALLLVKHSLGLKHIKVVNDLDASLPQGLIDPEKTVQVFINLFTNAIDGMSDGGTLTVRTCLKQPGDPATDPGARAVAGCGADDPVLVAEIEDNGSGIPPDKLPRIFDPFFTTKPPGKGTGLGLTVTRKIIELHGGRLEVSNREERGVRCVLEFLALDTKHAAQGDFEQWLDKPVLGQAETVR